MKRIFKLGVILVLVLMTTGCVKMEFSMGIHKDKSMDMKIITAVDKSIFGEDDSSFDTEKVDEIEEQGFLVRDYKEGNMEGYEFTKLFDNIDNMSTEEDGYVSDFYKVFEQPNAILFSKKKGFFKDTYIAKLDVSNDELSSGNTNNGLTGDTNSGLTNDSNIQLPENFDYSGLMTGIDAKFVVELPYKVVSTNATTVSDNQKELTWDLMSNKLVEFEFNLYNMTNIYIVGGILLIVLFWIIVLIVKIFGGRKPNNNNFNKQSFVTNTEQQNLNLNNNLTNSIPLNQVSNPNINDQVNNTNCVNNSFINNIDNTTSNNTNTLDTNNYFNTQSFVTTTEQQKPNQNNSLTNSIPLEQLTDSNPNNQINNYNNDTNNETINLGLDTISYNFNQVNTSQSNILENTDNSNSIFIQDTDKFN